MPVGQKTVLMLIFNTVVCIPDAKVLNLFGLPGDNPQRLSGLAEAV